MTTLTSKIDTKAITIRLSLLRFFGFRNWLTIKLLALVGIVSPFTISVEVESA